MLQASRAGGGACYLRAGESVEAVFLAGKPSFQGYINM